MDEAFAHTLKYVHISPLPPRHLAVLQFFFTSLVERGGGTIHRPFIPTPWVDSGGCNRSGE